MWCWHDTAAVNDISCARDEKLLVCVIECDARDGLVMSV